MIYRVYCASGWFTPNQETTYKQICEILSKFKKSLDVFYPKEQSADLQGSLGQANTRHTIFERNVRGIDDCDFMVCSTEDKDTGSIFEAGYAHAIGKPIVYVNFHLGSSAFNLMLAESAIAVTKDPGQLEDVLKKIVRVGLEEFSVLYDSVNDINMPIE